MHMTQYMKLFFEISGPEITPDKANLLIKQLREKLEITIFEKDNVKGRVDDVDNFSCQQINPNLVRGRYDSIRWELVNNSPNWVDDYNNTMKPRLAKLLKSIEFKKYKTILRVVEIDYV